MLTVGDIFPEYKLTAVVSADPKDAFKDVTQDSFKGKWKIYMWWPKDFTFVCPTEIVGYDKLNKQFADRDAVLLGLSTDSEYVHLAWRTHHADMNKISMPMLSDIKRELATACGILHKDAGVALRATFIVDPENVIRHVQVNDLSVGRSPEEALRILDALQSDELCPCNWQKGDPTIQVG